MASREVFHFDEFTLDVQERRLLRGAEAVRLSPKAYDVLVALVQQRGRLVTKDELLKRLWPESFVEEGGLSVHVSALRKALGEDANRPIYIETVARSGYRFIAAVTCDPAWPLRGEPILGGSDNEPRSGLRRGAEDGIHPRRSGKLAALVPAPRVHLTRFHGILGPRREVARLDRT